jgi:hypothetical protein
VDQAQKARAGIEVKPILFRDDKNSGLLSRGLALPG